MDNYLRKDGNGESIPIFVCPDSASTIKVDGTSASATTTAVLSTTTDVNVRIAADSDCYILAGAAPTALNNGTCMKLYAGSVTDLIIMKNQKLAVIGGIIYITPMP